MGYLPFFSDGASTAGRGGHCQKVLGNSSLTHSHEQENENEGAGRKWNSVKGENEIIKFCKKKQNFRAFYI